jgi:regulator of nonsense transcripts 2
MPGGIWSDEEERRFYEDIIDLKDRVPPTLLDDATKSAGTVDQRPASPEFVREEPKDDGASLDGDEISDTSSEHSAGVNEEKSTLDTNTTIVNKGVGQKVDLLLMRMPESTNRDMIDQITVEFIFLNSKASRNRLLKKLLDVPRNRQDVLPYYSRLIATLSRYLPEIGKAVVEEVCLKLILLTYSWARISAGYKGRKHSQTLAISMSATLPSSRNSASLLNTSYSTV